MSVSRRILIQVALGAAIVLAVVTALTYWLVYNALKTRDLRNLDTYVRERAEREEARFLEVQTNLRLVRAMFLKRLNTPMPPEHVEERFNYWNRRFDDGAWRTREAFGDARKNASFWADKEWPATPEMRRQAVIVQELCDEMLPGWVDSFPSYYFQFPAPGLVNAGVDVLLADWSWKMPAHFDTAGLEWIALALPKEMPDGERFSWTGVAQDDVVGFPVVSVYLPVMNQGSFVASVGHNMPITRLIDPAAQSGIPGASHFIFREDGRLIAYPPQRDRIMQSKGLLTAGDCGDAVVSAIYQTAIHDQARRFSGFEPHTGTHYSVARLAGPEWLYVTVMPNSFLTQQAASSAQWVLWCGLASLALLLAMFAGVLQRLVTRPLAALTGAADGMSAGTVGVAVPELRADEFGALAASFAVMLAKVTERENELRTLNQSLEQRVADRTAELDAALSHERELNEMKSQFVSLVSHEFRTPLGVIMSASDVLSRYFDRLPEEKRVRHLDMILRSTRNLASLIEEVLLLGRVEEGRMQFNPVLLDLEKLCRVIADELLSATTAQCPIHFVLDGDFTGARSDEALLRHIIPNLLSNAVKYSDSGQPVEFTVARDGVDVVITVRDRGIGIPVEDQSRIFTSFTRASNVGTRQGTGLGLVIVQRCILLHGGSIELHSTVGEGTTVTVTLPMFV